MLPDLANNSEYMGEHEILEHEIIFIFMLHFANAFLLFISLYSLQPWGQTTGNTNNMKK